MDFSLRADLQHIPLCRPSASYRPFMYPWAEKLAVFQRQIHWLTEEASLGLDVRDYVEFDDTERYLLNNALKLFTQSDIDISNDYMGLYLPIFRNGEVQRMLGTFMATEFEHIRAYAAVNDTLGLPDTVYGEFLSIQAMRDKHDLLSGFTMNNEEDIATTLALVSGFGEGLMLYASFALMLNYTRWGKMKGLGQILSWSQKDENLHCQGVMHLHHQFVKEANIDRNRLRDRIMDGCTEVIRLEDAFIDHCFEAGPLKGLESHDMKRYIRHIADIRLESLGFDTVYNEPVHPLPWLIPLTGAVEHANFFESRATEYTKGSSTGEWGAVWDNFDLVKDKLEVMH